VKTEPGSGDGRHAAKSRGTLLVQAWAIACRNQLYAHNLQTIYGVTEIMYVFGSNVRNRKTQS